MLGENFGFNKVKVVVLNILIFLGVFGIIKFNN